MRFFTFFIFLFGLSTIGQESARSIQKYEITVSAAKCKYERGYAFLKEFVLYKGDQKLQTVPLAHDPTATLKNLTSGHYQIKYKTIYNKWGTVNFELGNEKKVDIKLCMDTLDYAQNTNILLIDQLNENETLELLYHSQGCFHQDKENVKFTKKKGQFIVEYNDLKKTLTKKQAQFLREFEIELRSNLGTGCTTTDRYSLYIDKPGNFDEMYSQNDGSCSWNGFSNLLDLLKLEKKS